jgi:predicted GIY-YIG superfamily endonuclease
MERQLAMFPPSRPLRERFGVEFFRQVPETPGVYLLCGPRDGVLYVGKAKNLRQRLGSYRSANPDLVPRKLRRLLATVERILWDECPSEDAALARERELLRTLRPRFNTVGVRPASPDWLGWRSVTGGLDLGCGEVTDGWPERHGPFGQSRALLGALLRLLWWRLNSSDPSAPAVAAAPPDADWSVTRATTSGRAELRLARSSGDAAPPCRVRALCATGLAGGLVSFPSSGSWADMPAALTAERPPRQWTLAMAADSAALVLRLLNGFFREGSLDLIEWGLAAAEARPRFERAWLERDAICLLEVYERLTAETNADAGVH